MKFRHRPNLNIDATFAEESGYLYRYLMDIQTNSHCENGKTVCAIMQNPSIASVEFADKSVQVLERVIFEHDLREFESVNRLLIVNQFGFVQTNDFVGADWQIGTRNFEYVENAITKSDIILIAWGSSNPFPVLQNQIHDMISNHSKKILLKTSVHPSRVKYSGFIQKF